MNTIKKYSSVSCEKWEYYKENPDDKDGKLEEDFFIRQEYYRSQLQDVIKQNKVTHPQIFKKK